VSINVQLQLWTMWLFFSKTARRLLNHHPCKILESSLSSVVLDAGHNNV